jgi:uncharacterized protein
MLPELEALLQIQRHDVKLMALRKRLEEIPRRREALEAAVNAARTALDQAKKDLEQARLARRVHEKEIESIQAEGVKLERQLLDVKTNKEYTAMLHEIELTKSRRSDRETQVLESYEREEALAAMVSAAERRVAAETAALKAGQETLEKERATTDQELHSVTQDREAVTPQIPAPLLSRYDRVARSRDGVGVAEVRKGACAACFRALTPQALQEVRRNDAIQACESCGRILIWVEGSAS